MIVTFLNTLPHCFVPFAFMGIGTYTPVSSAAISTVQVEGTGRVPGEDRNILHFDSQYQNVVFQTQPILTFRQVGKTVCLSSTTSILLLLVGILPFKLRNFIWQLLSVF